jgi:hypothetical protein
VRKLAPAFCSAGVLAGVLPSDRENKRAGEDAGGTKDNIAPQEQRQDAGLKPRILPLPSLLTFANLRSGLQSGGKPPHSKEADERRCFKK